jgi:RNA polymerase sigma-70 factor (ECF subfamily)
MPALLRMCTGTTPLEPQPSALAAARGGDRDAFATLVSPHTLRLRRLAHRLTRSAEDAEDVCQESLLKAFTKLDQFAGTKTEEGEFCAWLMRITANCAIDFLRRKDANKLIPLDECDYIHNKFHEPGVGGWGESPEASCTRQEQLRLVANALAELPPELRNVCLLRNMMEPSTKEVAARLGISAIAVRLRLFRAHGQLREILGRRTVHGRAARARRLMTVRAGMAESLN